MKSVFCRVRNYEDGDRLPVKYPSRPELCYLEFKPNETFRCQQPDSLDSDEFNLIVFLGRRKIRAKSIDFQFYETRKQSEEDIREELKWIKSIRS